MFNNEQFIIEKVVKYYEKTHLETWHNIGPPRTVKKSITYKEITVAIGILVAMVIALTLWIRVPDSDVSVSASKRTVGLATSAQNVYKSVVSLFPQSGF